MLRKGASCKALVLYQRGGEKHVHLRRGLSQLPQFYLLALADAGRVQEPILHAQTEVYYKRLLKLPGSVPAHDLRAARRRGLCFELGEPDALPLGKEMFGGSPGEKLEDDDDGSSAGHDAELATTSSRRKSPMAT